MRFLIVASVFACAAAAPSGVLAPLAYAPAAHLAPALPTISAGDINGAAIEAHVEASDHLRAAVDATRQFHDKASELQGQAINNAEEHAWRAVDAVKTVEARLDGAAAGAAPHLAKSIVRTSVVAPISYAAPIAAPISYAAPVAAPISYASPVSYAAPLAYSAPLAPAVYSGYGPAAYSAPWNYAQAW